MCPDEAKLLESIDQKLTALLSISVDEHLRSNPELVEPRPRSIDRLLRDAGLPTTEIANILGKTSRAVQKMLKKEKPHGDD